MHTVFSQFKNCEHIELSKHLCTFAVKKHLPPFEFLNFCIFVSLNGFRTSYKM